MYSVPCTLLLYMCDDRLEAGDVVAGEPQLLESMMRHDILSGVGQTIVTQPELSEGRQLGQQLGHCGPRHMVTIQNQLGYEIR